MSTKFNLEVVTPDRIFFGGETDMTIVRTTEGDLGILHDHEPLVAPLRVGSIRVKQENGTFRWAACTEGFVIVNDEKVTIITDSAEWADEIDVDRAQKAKERAEHRLHIHKVENKDIDVARAKAALERAINRMRLYVNK